MEVMPVELTGLIGTIGGILIVLIPVAGLTARFALKPIVEAISRAREIQGGNRETAILEQRVALLEQQIRSMEGSMERLVEDSEFRRQLEAPHG
jgi:cell division protein FtsB